jgi:hypothetical protein
MPRTEAEIRQAIATADAALAGVTASAYPRELFPELARHNAHHTRRSRKTGRYTNDGRSPLASAPTQPAPPAQAARPPAADGDLTLTPENVARWSAELGFQRPARVGRVSRADD